MFEYISVKEAAGNWGISERRIQKLCEEKRIDGVVRFGHAWAIPKNAEIPQEEIKSRYNNHGGVCLHIRMIERKLKNL